MRFFIWRSVSSASVEKPLITRALRRANPSAFFSKWRALAGSVKVSFSAFPLSPLSMPRPSMANCLPRQWLHRGCFSSISMAVSRMDMTKAYLNSVGKPLPRLKGNFFFRLNVFSIFRIITYCFKRSFTSFSLVPEPRATRLIREELKTFGFLLPLEAHRLDDNPPLFKTTFSRVEHLLGNVGGHSWKHLEHFAEGT